MSFFDIDIRVSKLLMEIAEGERSIEVTRRVLSDCIEYDSYRIFKNLDTEKKGAISPKNIIDFLFQKKINISQEEANLIIFFYDKNHDGLLSYDEFVNLIESKNKTNKKIIKKFLNDYNGLSYNIIFSLEKLLQKELQLAKDIIFSLNGLKDRLNFDIHDIFHSIKGTNNITIESLKKYLEKNNISFLESDIYFIFNRLDINKDGIIDFVEFHSLFGYPYCYYCCPCIICPFCKTECCNECLIGTNGCIHHNLNTQCNCPKNGTKIMTNIRSNSYNNRTDSPIRNNEEKISNSLSLRLSPERKYGPIEVDIYDNSNNSNNNYFSDKNKNNSNQQKINSGKFFNKTQINNNRNNITSNNNLSPSHSSPNNSEEKISNSLSLRLSPERKYGPYEVELEACNSCNNIPCTCNNLNINNKNININQYNNTKNRNNNSCNNSNLKKDEINQLNGFLKTLMEGEKEIELYKVELALKRDFNCEDIFRIFEYKSAGYITSEDLKYGLDLLDIKTNEYIINLLMNRFDLMKRGKINYADFFDMIVPFQRSYRNLVEAKIPLSNDPMNILSILNKNTICSLKVLFVCIIEFEFRINDIRKKINNLKGKLMELFKLIDTNNYGFFDYSNLINYLQKSKIDFKQLNADLLFIRLDKNRNGKIDFKEFEDEFLGL